MAIDVLQAAKHLCKESEWRLTNLELQKIIYITHMLYLGQKGIKCPLVEGTFQAWDYGPVHPDLYSRINRYKCGADFISEKVFKNVKDLNEKDHSDQIFALKEVFDLYPPGSSLELIEDTHQEKGAWYKRYIPGIKGIPITNHDILEEYNNLEEIKKD